MAGKGRSKKAQASDLIADRERHALFAELAKRPETVCPFLGLASSRAGYHDGITPEHRCYAFGEPADVSSEQQNQVCLQRGYGNCPRYLRGVLVIPTEELAALRRQKPIAPNPVKPEETIAPVVAGKRWSPRVSALVLVAALALGGIAAGIVLFTQGPVAVLPSPSTSPSSAVLPSSAPSLAPTPSPTATAPAATATPVGTPYPETPAPEATPRPGDQFVGFEVIVLDRSDVVFEVSADGKLIAQYAPGLDQFAHLSVHRVIALSGLLHWRVEKGPILGWSFLRDRSGPFQVRSIYRGSDGELRYYVLPEESL